MVVKILYTAGPNGHFPAVKYNTDKMDRNTGELVKAANFGPLQAMGQLRPQDYKNYLQMVSALNKSVKKPQFHVAISGEGRRYDKQELTEIAEQWMKGMGYDKQPYLIIFHKDTANNHVHIVSTRVKPDGKKIKDSYEQIKAQQQMQVVMGIDPKHNAENDTTNALTYRVNTKAQFLMVLESMAYSHKEENGSLLLFKYGKQQGAITMTDIEKRIGAEPQDEARQKQLTAWFHKYAGLYDTALTKSHGKYCSPFSAFLKEKMGVELLFHSSGDKPPYGYTVIDHAQRNVFKGGEIMALKELLADQIKDETKQQHSNQEPRSANQSETDYYAAILKAILHNYPDMVQGLQHQQMTLTKSGFSYFFEDVRRGIVTNAKDLLDDDDFLLMAQQFKASNTTTRCAGSAEIYVPSISIANDIDDEAVHGRRRKKKARNRSR